MFKVWRSESNKTATLECKYNAIYEERIGRKHTGHKLMATKRNHTPKSVSDNK